MRVSNRTRNDLRVFVQGVPGAADLGAETTKTLPVPKEPFWIYGCAPGSFDIYGPALCTPDEAETIEVTLTVRR